MSERVKVTLWKINFRDTKVNECPKTTIEERISNINTISKYAVRYTKFNEEKQLMQVLLVSTVRWK